jgi:hypothetical protein
MNNYYRLYGLSVQSAFLLPGAPKLHSPLHSYDVSLLWQPETDWQPDRWRITHVSTHLSRPDFGQADDGSVYLAWGDELKVLINPQRNEVRILSRIEKLEYAPTVIVGFVFGYLLHLRGQLCLHGSIIELADRTIAVLGDSGAGKSTIAAALIKSGARLLSDDLIVISNTIEGVFVHSGCLGLRLTTSSAEHLFPGNKDIFGHVPWLDKKLWDMSSVISPSFFQERPLKDIYLLEPVEETSDVIIGEPLPQSNALQRLIEMWYPPENLHLLSQERLLQIQRVSNVIPVRVIRYVKKWDSLTKLVDLLASYSFQTTNRKYPSIL